MACRINARRRGRGRKKKLGDKIKNPFIVNGHLLSLLGKKPANRKEWRESSDELMVVAGFFFDKMQESVRNGVLLAINDAFGKK